MKTKAPQVHPFTGVTIVLQGTIVHSYGRLGRRVLSSIIKRLVNTAEPFESIARMYHLSRQNTHYLYRRYLAPALGLTGVNWRAVGKETTTTNQMATESYHPINLTIYPGKPGDMGYHLS